ncbi:MAG TPA: host attachment protein [Acetobacteraceae bacterium]|nr:host attachment protein [Acetobacteraceae bacterium]
MARHRNLLILIADGEHARFLRVAPDGALYTESSVDSLSAHQRSADLGTDHPGAAFHSDASVHHAFAPRHDLHTANKLDFAKLIGDQLNGAAERHDFDALVLVAPPHVQAAIRARLARNAEAMVIGGLGKDLVKTPDDALQPHLAAWVRPARRRDRAGP